jgi:hypothetical protein
VELSTVGRVDDVEVFQIIQSLLSLLQAVSMGFLVVPTEGSSIVVIPAKASFLPPQGCSCSYGRQTMKHGCSNLHQKNIISDAIDRINIVKTSKQTVCLCLDPIKGTAQNQPLIVNSIVVVGNQDAVCVVLLLVEARYA